MNTTTQNFRRIEELIPGHWTEGTTSCGIHYYQTGGQKPALLLLHGFMMSGLSWLRLAKVMEQDYDLVMPDLRAHGRSVGIEQGYTTELQTEDMANLVHELKLDKPAVIGHSNGAMLAAYLVAFHPDLVRAIVLEDPPFGTSVPKPDLNDPDNPFTAWYNGWIAWLRGLHDQTHEERIAASLA